VTQISIIMPTYNGSKYVIETIESVLNQTFQNFELIIIDDGSTDNTVELISNLSPKIRLICQENKGIAQARNTGLESASGEYIAFIDHDDIWHPEKLSLQVAYLENNQQVGVVYSSYIRWKSTKPYPFEVKHIDSKLDDELSGWIYHHLLLINRVLFTTALFRASICNKVGEFSSKLPPSDDWDYAVRASRVCKFAKISMSLALYRVHENQTSRKISSVNSEAEYRKIAISKYGLLSPNGEKVDKKSLKKRFFKNHFDFGYLHYHHPKGQKKLALSAFVKAIKYNPLNIKSYIFMLLTLLRK